MDAPAVRHENAGGDTFSERQLMADVLRHDCPLKDAHPPLAATGYAYRPAYPAPFFFSTARALTLFVAFVRCVCATRPISSQRLTRPRWPFAIRARAAPPRGNGLPAPNRVGHASRRLSGP